MSDVNRRGPARREYSRGLARIGDAYCSVDGMLSPFTSGWREDHNGRARSYRIVFASVQPAVAARQPSVAQANDSRATSTVSTRTDEHALVDGRSGSRLQHG